jgi:hypothetical protein
MKPCTSGCGRLLQGEFAEIALHERSPRSELSKIGAIVLQGTIGGDVFFEHTKDRRHAVHVDDKMCFLESRPRRRGQMPRAGKTARRPRGFPASVEGRPRAAARVEYVGVKPVANLGGPLIV